MTLFLRCLLTCEQAVETWGQEHDSSTYSATAESVGRGSPFAKNWIRTTSFPLSSPAGTTPKSLPSESTKGPGLPPKADECILPGDGGAPSRGARASVPNSDQPTYLLAKQRPLQSKARLSANPAFFEQRIHSRIKDPPAHRMPMLGPGTFSIYLRMWLFILF